MFNFFKKDPYNRKMPAEYKHLMNQRAYEAFLDTVLQYFKEKGEPVLKVEDGYIVTKEGEGQGLEFKYGLDNLVRLVAPAPKEDQESIIYSHFNKVSHDRGYMQYYKKDYEAAKPFLKILIKDESILQTDGAKNIVYYTTFPGTVNVLVFDYDEKFTYLNADEVKEWEKSNTELFEAAQENINQEQINIHQLEYEKSDFEVFAFFSGDFSAPYMLSLEQNAPFAVGQYGAVVAIPTKGTAFVSPIKDNDVVGRINLMADPVTKFYDEDPGNITSKFYWYFEGVFQLFPETPSTEKEGFVTLSLPQPLIQLLKEA